MSLNDILIPLQKDVDELERVMIGLLSSQVPFVQSVAEYTIKNGGKRLRPILTLICARLAGSQGLSAYKMGSCIEFVHTASLLHDDVIDNAKLRRGKPSTNSKWGNHVSVLVGDFFYCRASQLLTEQGNLKILKIVTDAITALTEGEVLEITKNLDLNTTEDDYLAIIKNKTAILFAAASQIGGVLGNVSEEYELALRNYGLNLGMAFQLADDALDYTATEEVFGKESGIDLQEGKLTLPLLVAIKCATPTEQQTIKSALMSDKIEKSVFQEIRDIILKYQGFDETYKMAQSYVELAKEQILPFRPSIEKDILLHIADYVTARDR
jgi:octaprenyl-diphosphate synthase